MTASRTKLARIQSVQSDRAPTIQSRLDRRISVLRDWLDNGVPAGFAVPTSLTKARLWENSELGIIRISSPNEFTTGHAHYGESISTIGDLLSKLRQRTLKPRGSKRAESVVLEGVPRSKSDFLSSKRALEEAVSQWHRHRDQVIHEKDRADAAEARILLLQEECRKLEMQLAELRRDLAKKHGLHPVS